MNRLRIISCGIISTLALLSLPPAAIADQNRSIELKLRPGERVRITKRNAAKADPLIGIYRSATAESVEVIQHDTKAGLDTRLSVPIDDVAWIEVSRGRTHHTLAGALVGILAGGAATLAGLSKDNEMSGFVVVVFVPVGAITGAFVGSGIVSDKWEKVWEQPHK